MHPRLAMLSNTIINHGIYYCKATNKYRNEGGMLSNIVINRPTIVVSSLNLRKTTSKNIQIMLYATPMIYYRSLRAIGIELLVGMEVVMDYVPIYVV
jgi:hypothetical protein